MPKLSDLRVLGVDLYFLPIALRVPLKFGAHVTRQVHCARVCLRVADRAGRRAAGWGETPLAVAWSWPSGIDYVVRQTRMEDFCRQLAEAWVSGSSQLGDGGYGHPIELGYDFQAQLLPRLINQASSAIVPHEKPIPHLAALVCLSAFDIALHDALGMLHGCDTYSTYGRDWLNRDLAAMIEPAGDLRGTFAGRYPDSFLIPHPPQKLLAWHLVGGLDPLDASELTGEEPRDGYPTTLVDWIAADGLQCLKIKLRGNDDAWDYARLVRVGEIAAEKNVSWLTADFNCTVSDPAYVNEILDRLKRERPAIDAKLLYVEQPFPYELDHHPIDVHSVSQRKPLFLDESAHDWRYVRRGRELGWTGVALKTCKTQTGALLSLCWAKLHGMALMVQDLTNPMLAQIPHLRLAAHAGTIMGVETNGMQFYPAASLPEAAVHPGMYRRRDGQVDLATISGTGFGYRIEEITRQLPAPALQIFK